MTLKNTVLTAAFVIRCGGYVLILIMAFLPAAANAIPAFPGAEGWNSDLPIRPRLPFSLLCFDYTGIQTDKDQAPCQNEYKSDAKRPTEIVFHFYLLSSM